MGNATDDDIAAFADAGLTVNHNPLGNAMFGFATAKQGAIPKMIDAGIPIVLGSDYAGSMIATPFDSMKDALSIHREAGGADNTISFEDVIVNGEVVVDGGEVTTVDESAVLAEAQGLLASMR